MWRIFTPTLSFVLKQVRVCKKILDDYARFTNMTPNSTGVPMIPSPGISQSTNGSLGELDDFFENMEQELQRRAEQVFRRRKRRDTPSPNRRECRLRVLPQLRQCAILSSCCSEVEKYKKYFRWKNFQFQKILFVDAIMNSNHQNFTSKFDSCSWKFLIKSGNVKT